ncbi:MAG: hypothetical protein FIA99_07895 [Ruminiclostridium sp.]|nr:hypothetical protein [Ruminiclostridium sp.]
MSLSDNRESLAADSLERAADYKSTGKIYRKIPGGEGEWSRGGQLVRIPLHQLEQGFPAGINPENLSGFAVVAYDGGNWIELPCDIERVDGFMRHLAFDDYSPGTHTELVFPAPASGKPAYGGDWSGSHEYEGYVKFRLWDSEKYAGLDNIRLYYNTAGHMPELNDQGPISAQQDKNGISIMLDGERLIHFEAQRSYQIDYAAIPGTEVNMVPDGAVWRWMLSASIDNTEKIPEEENIRLSIIKNKGQQAILQLEGKNNEGEMSATLRIFKHEKAVILEFSDYRTRKFKPEPPKEVINRIYAGISSYHATPDEIYSPFVLVSRDPDAAVMDYSFKFQQLKCSESIERYQVKDGWNWLALRTQNGVAAVTAHARTHYPDLPWWWVKKNNVTAIGIECYGGCINEHLNSADTYCLVLAPEVDDIRQAFDQTDTYPLLAMAYPVRPIPVMEGYECLTGWINLCHDYILSGKPYHRAVLTDGMPLDACDCLVVPVSEFIGLYKKTGYTPFLDKACEAALHAADWLLSGKHMQRGDLAIAPNDGGIYQSELIYIILSLAEVYRFKKEDRLLRAIDSAINWMENTKGGTEQWGWSDYSWHAGGWWQDGRSIYAWPVNTNQFATLNFRLWGILGERKYFNRAMDIINDYYKHQDEQGYVEVLGGGASDTTRGVHLFAEAWELWEKEWPIPRETFRKWIGFTLERFWTYGWARVRHSIYMETFVPGKVEGEMFSPGVSHWHNCGSALDIIPRIECSAWVGVLPELTRFALRDFCYDFDQHFGLEEHTHLAAFTIRHSDIMPASWLDPEMMPMLYAAGRQGWLTSEDRHTILYKTHRMLQLTYIPMDETHGGWACVYDARTYLPLRYLNYPIEHRHSHERINPGEKAELWGVPVREAFHDHSSHYWSALASLIDDLLTIEEAVEKDGCLEVKCRDTGSSRGLGLARVALIPLTNGGRKTDIKLYVDGKEASLTEIRNVTIGGNRFMLITCEQSAVVSTTAETTELSLQK